MELNGVPLHPLVVHGAVVFAPLAALAALVNAVVPAWRWAVRWPAVVLAVVAAGAVQLAKMSGEDLRDERGLLTPLVATHEMWADRLVLATWALALVAVLAWWALPVRSRLVGGADRPSRSGALDVVLRVLLVVLALLVMYLAFRTGDAGAAAVWT